MMKEKGEDEEYYDPFTGLQKTAVLQESRLFHEAPINVRKCCFLLTKILYLLGQGEAFTQTESTQLFFAVTRLFQSKDVDLRRMMYLVLKGLKPTEQEVIIVTSSLTKDMSNQKDSFRANATRVLCKITDSTMLVAIERHLKSAIVDKSPIVAAATLSSGVHLMKTSPEVPKRWVNEVQEALNSKSPMVQYHALGLLREIKTNDRLAATKVVANLTKNVPRSPLAQCLLVRYCIEVLEEDSNSQVAQQLISYLQSCLRNKQEMVMFEAAKAICNFSASNSPGKVELTSAINCLDTFFLGSNKPVYRFAAVRCLNKVAMQYPIAVITCNVDLECLITDPNRSIATLAITTLLKTGSESSVDRLMKQIGSFMGDIADEFKVVVVDAIRSLCLKFVEKHRMMMSFLSNMLREEGGYDFKKSIVDSLLELISQIPEAKDLGLSQLCEFIEDCEYSQLAIQVLNMIGELGPSTAEPSRYIRFVYNRVILENASVRAAAIGSLAKFGSRVPSLKDNVLALIRRSLADNDDEVRDRATFYMKMLSREEDNESSAKPTNSLHFGQLESALTDYIAGGAAPQPFPFAEFRANAAAAAANAKLLAAAGGSSSNEGASASSGPNQAAQKKAKKGNMYSELLNSVPQLAALSLGKLFSSSRTVELTEPETEYVVTCVKHIFAEHIVFQFNCTNTVQELQLENVSVQLTLNDVEGLEPVLSVPAATLAYDQTNVAFVVFAREGDDYPTGTVPATLQFTLKEIDDATGEPMEDGIDDHYQVEDIELTAGDYMDAGDELEPETWHASWNSLDGEESAVAVRLVDAKTLQGAVDHVCDLLGMSVSGGKKSPNGRTHEMNLSGEWIGSQPLLANCKFTLDKENKVLMKLAVRGATEDVREVVTDSVA